MTAVIPVEPPTKAADPAKKDLPSKAADATKFADVSKTAPNPAPQEVKKPADENPKVVTVPERPAPEMPAPNSKPEPQKPAQKPEPPRPAPQEPQPVVKPKAAEREPQEPQRHPSGPGGAVSFTRKDLGGNVFFKVDMRIVSKPWVRWHRTLCSTKESREALLANVGVGLLVLKRLEDSERTLAVDWAPWDAFVRRQNLPLPGTIDVPGPPPKEAQRHPGGPGGAVSFTQTPSTLSFAVEMRVMSRPWTHWHRTLCATKESRETLRADVGVGLLLLRRLEDSERLRIVNWGPWDSFERRGLKYREPRRVVVQGLPWHLGQRLGCMDSLLKPGTSDIPTAEATCAEVQKRAAAVGITDLPVRQVSPGVFLAAFPALAASIQQFPDPFDACPSEMLADETNKLLVQESETDAFFESMCENIARWRWATAQRRQCAKDHRWPGFFLDLPFTSLTERLPQKTALRGFADDWQPPLAVDQAALDAFVASASEAFGQKAAEPSLMGPGDAAEEAELRRIEVVKGLKWSADVPVRRWSVKCDGWPEDGEVLLEYVERAADFARESLHQEGEEEPMDFVLPPNGAWAGEGDEEPAHDPQEPEASWESSLRVSESDGIIEVAWDETFVSPAWSVPDADDELNVETAKEEAAAWGTSLRLSTQQLLAGEWDESFSSPVCLRHDAVAKDELFDPEKEPASFPCLPPARADNTGSVLKRLMLKGQEEPRPNRELTDAQRRRRRLAPFDRANPRQLAFGEGPRWDPSRLVPEDYTKERAREQRVSLMARLEAERVDAQKRMDALWPDLASWKAIKTKDGIIIPASGKALWSDASPSFRRMFARAEARRKKAQVVDKLEPDLDDLKLIGVRLRDLEGQSDWKCLISRDMEKADIDKFTVVSRFGGRQIALIKRERCLTCRGSSRVDLHFSGGGLWHQTALNDFDEVWWWVRKPADVERASATEGWLSLESVAHPGSYLQPAVAPRTGWLESVATESPAIWQLVLDHSQERVLPRSRSTFLRAEIPPRALVAPSSYDPLRSAAIPLEYIRSKPFPVARRAVFLGDARRAVFLGVAWRMAHSTHGELCY